MRRNTKMVHLGLLSVALALAAADPPYLRRSVPSIAPAADDLTASARGASYKPIFGIGDADAKQLKGIARYGELTVLEGGASAVVSYPAEEQIYFVLEGAGKLIYGGETAPLRRLDFAYLPIGVKHGVRGGPIRVMVMGFRIPRDVTPAPTPKLMLANADDVPLVPVQGHGPTSLFKLLMGTTESKRDKLAAASQMVSLFIMDFAPGGTNIPHHHEMEEEIYFILRGKGDMVAGEGRYPVKQGEAFFIRLNSNVGFYSGSKEGEEHDQVLAVRSRFPFPRGPR